MVPGSLQGLILGALHDVETNHLVVNLFLELFKLNTDGYADFAGMATMKVFYLENPVFFKTKFYIK